MHFTLRQATVILVACLSYNQRQNELSKTWKKCNNYTKSYKETTTVICKHNTADIAKTKKNQSPTVDHKPRHVNLDWPSIKQSMAFDWITHVIGLSLIMSRSVRYT